MKKDSFSLIVKEHLRNVNRKKKCCRRAFDDGAATCSGIDLPHLLINKGAAGLVCGECAANFIAGLFVAFGNLSDPNRSYHLEFSFPDEDSANAACAVLSDVGFIPGRSIRKGRFLLYYKNSTLIEDFLGYIGASFGVFELMNAKIMKEMRGNTNRQVNCDSANISKTIGAAEKQIKIITELKEQGSFNALTGDLKETADLRVKFPDASIVELGQKFTPPISKSGVKHRLDRIIDFYESEKVKKNNNE